MQFSFYRNKRRPERPFAILLGLYFSLPLTSVFADPPQQATRKTWQVPHAAGKPGPYSPPITPGIVMTSGTTKSLKGSQPKVTVGKLAPSVSSSTASVNDQMVLQSRDISTFGPIWQSFSDYLTVPAGCEKVPFSLTFSNGVGSNPRFKDIRINLAGKSLATIKDFNGQGQLTRNLTGAIGVGDTLLVVQAYGPPGAKLNWQFTTPKVTVSSVSPKDIALNKPLTINGTNFCEQASTNQVFFDKTPVTVISASKTQLQVKVPASILGGKADLVVAVGPSRSKPFKITVKSAPKIAAVNMISTAPGQPLTITGEGFSSKSGENQVYFGSVAAEIVSCTPTSITVIVPVPANDYPAWGVPIKVKTNGVESVDPNEKGSINIQSRVFGDESSR